MAATNERVIYRNGSTVVTDTSANISGQTYDLHGVAAVSMVPPVLRRWMGGVLLTIGLIILVVGYFVWNRVFLTPMLGGVVLIIAGAALYAMVRERYTVTITRQDGQQTRLQVPDANHAQQLVEAISNVIRKTG